MARRIAYSLIGLYQLFLSPLLGSRCRFWPTCSAYSRECFTRFSFFKALRRSMGRLVKCHPFHPGGLDPVPRDGGR